MAKICVLPGDGVGPEVVAEARKVLDEVMVLTGLDISYTEASMGGCAIDEFGDPLPEATLEQVFDSDALLLGAVGGPKWDKHESGKRPEQGLLRLRKTLDLYANLRPVKIFPALRSMSPLADVASGKIRPDMVIVRELSSGLYFGEPRYRQETEDHLAVDTLAYYQSEVDRIAKAAFEAAGQSRGKVTSVDKANVLESSRLWRETVQKISGEYPNVDVDYMYVDNCAMQLVTNPEQFDVVLASNMFGDILSDLTSVLPGSIGLMPSASLGTKGVALYEPVHGSAPDIAGQGIVNPVAAVLSASMLLRQSLGMEHAADKVEQAVDQVLEAGYRTKDIYNQEDRQTTLVTTAEMGDKLAQTAAELIKSS